MASKAETPDTTDDIEPPEEAMADSTEQPAWVDLLQADTPKEEVHQRAALGKGGTPVMRDGQPLMLDYVTARFVMDRLDAAVGPTNWQTMFETLQGGMTQAVRCGISIRPPGTDEWITKWDVGTPSSIEPEKGAHSDAFKRAGVHWGIARDLYDTRDEDRLAPTVVPGAGNVAAQGGMRAQVMAGAEQQAQPQQQAMPQIQQYDEEGNATGRPAWVCPMHDDAKIVPAGISKRTGRQYNAFYACPVAGCDQKGPSLK